MSIDIETKYKHAIRALQNIASKRFTNRDVYAAVTLKELGEECPKWAENMRVEQYSQNEMLKLLDGLRKR